MMKILWMVPVLVLGVACGSRKSSKPRLAVAASFTARAGAHTRLTPGWTVLRPRSPGRPIRGFSRSGRVRARRFFRLPREHVPGHALWVRHVRVPRSRHGPGMGKMWRPCPLQAAPCPSSVEALLQHPALSEVQGPCHGPWSWRRLGPSWPRCAPHQA